MDFQRLKQAQKHINPSIVGVISTPCFRVKNFIGFAVRINDFPTAHPKQFKKRNAGLVRRHDNPMARNSQRSAAIDLNLSRKPKSGVIQTKHEAIRTFQGETKWLGHINKEQKMKRTTNKTQTISKIPQSKNSHATKMTLAGSKRIIEVHKKSSNQTKNIQLLKTHSNASGTKK